MISLKRVLPYFFLIVIIFSASGDVDYDHPQKWEGNCQTGRFQSPIDIDTSNLQICPGVTTSFRYNCSQSPLKPSGLSFTIQTLKSGYIAIKDSNSTNPQVRLYQKIQFHLHSPSEHKINGKSYPLQMHNFFVALDQNVGRNINVTSQFTNFDTSNYSKNSVFASVLGYIFYPSDDINAIDLINGFDSNGIPQVNNQEILGWTTDNFWYHYRGSTTAPPCTQTVDWFVYKKPLPIKSAQYHAIKHSMNYGKPNARPVQPLNGRKVALIGGSCPQ